MLCSASCGAWVACAMGGMCHEQLAEPGYTAPRLRACTRYGTTVHSDRLRERAGNDARWRSCDFAYQVRVCPSTNAIAPVLVPVCGET
jgi:hypothetical protein